MYGSSKTICSVVADSDGLFLSLELGDRADRTEDLFLYNLHIFSDVGEDSGLDEVAFVANTLATSLDGGTSLLTSLDVAVLIVSMYVNLEKACISYLIILSN